MGIEAVTSATMIGGLARPRAAVLSSRLGSTCLQRRPLVVYAGKGFGSGKKSTKVGSGTVACSLAAQPHQQQQQHSCSCVAQQSGAKHVLVIEWDWKIQ